VQSFEDISEDCTCKSIYISKMTPSVIFPLTIMMW